MPVPTDEKPSSVSAGDPMSPVSKSSITPKPSPAAKDAPLTKTGTVSKATQPTKTTSPKNSPSKNVVPTPTVSGATPHDGTKKVRRKGSKPIINWFQRKIVGRKPPVPHPGVPGLERGRDPGPRHQRGASYSRSVGPASSRKRRSGTTAGDADGELEHSLGGGGTSVRSRSLSPSLGPESVWSPSTQLEADDDASIRPLPPTSPPSPSPSNSTHLSQTTYSGYGSDPRTAYISPATPLSIQTGLPVAVEADGARTSDDGPETAVPGRKSLENGDETEKESNDGHEFPFKEPEAGPSNNVKGNTPSKKVDAISAALDVLPSL
ncbi:hypothetical protein FRC09_010750 [Ceratobasidium sp. 395]|nr:hypothetical protein FRC09_010750 [Ceratobasidium sp. 395]